ncbi:hypothetical protein AHAT_41860 [Agarivorans sp. Toyoura001]|nr:hypothetical protein AHAT_41860 [Agarivorans sp. Toyoura001]
MTVNIIDMNNSNLSSSRWLELFSALKIGIDCEQKNARAARRSMSYMFLMKVKWATFK